MSPSPRSASHHCVCLVHPCDRTATTRCLRWDRDRGPRPSGTGHPGFVDRRGSRLGDSVTVDVRDQLSRGSHPGTPRVHMYQTSAGGTPDAEPVVFTGDVLFSARRPDDCPVAVARAGSLRNQGTAAAASWCCPARPSTHHGHRSAPRTVPAPAPGGPFVIRPRPLSGFPEYPNAGSSWSRGSTGCGHFECRVRLVIPGRSSAGPPATQGERYRIMRLAAAAEPGAPAELGLPFDLPPRPATCSRTPTSWSSLSAVPDPEGLAGGAPAGISSGFHPADIDSSTSTNPPPTTTRVAAVTLEPGRLHVDLGLPPMLLR